MRYGVDYAERSEAEFAAEQRTRLEKSLHRRAKEMGYELVPLSLIRACRARTAFSPATTLASRERERPELITRGGVEIYGRMRRFRNNHRHYLR